MKRTQNVARNEMESELHNSTLSAKSTSFNRKEL